MTNQSTNAQAERQRRYRERQKLKLAEAAEATAQSFGARLRERLQDLEAENGRLFDRVLRLESEVLRLKAAR